MSRPRPTDAAGQPACMQDGLGQPCVSAQALTRRGLGPPRPSSKAGKPHLLVSKRELRGEFVDLQPLTPAHAELTLAWRHSQRAVNLNQGAQTVTQQARWIATRPADEHNFVITLKNGLAVGTLSLCGVHATHRHAESGRFLIGEAAAVRGIPAAAEAMKLLYQLAFDRLGLLRVHGSIASDNLLMIKWQKFMGMQEEGRLRSHYFINGRIQDAVLFGILEGEFRNTALPRLNAMIAAARARAALAT